MEAIKFMNEVACQPFIFGTAVLSDTVAISCMRIFKFKLKLIKIKNSTLQSYQPPFQVLSSHTWPGTTILDNVDVEHFHLCRKSHCTTLTTRKQEEQEIKGYSVSEGQAGLSLPNQPLGAKRKLEKQIGKLIYTLQHSEPTRYWAQPSLYFRIQPINAHHPLTEKQMWDQGQRMLSVFMVCIGDSY